jgi:hypothetical protein
VTGLLIYRIVKDLSNEMLGARAAALWWFSPIAIVSSSVLGQYDSAVALLTLLALYMSFRRACLGAGIAFGLGLALKPTAWPAIVLLAGVIQSFGTLNKKGIALPRERLLPFQLLASLEFFAGFVLPLLGLWLANRLLGVGASLQTRLRFPVLGGINLWLVELIPHVSMQTLWRWGHTYFPLIQWMSLTVSLVGAAFVTLLVLRLNRSNGTTVYMACAVVLLLFLLVMPLTQPHYFVVAFPFLAICTAFGLLPGVGYIVLSIALAGYILSVWGPLIIWLPLVAHFHLVSSRLVVKGTVSLVEARGLLNDGILLDLRLLFAVIGFACAVWFVVVCMRRLLEGARMSPDFVDSSCRCSWAEELSHGQGQ